jgi:hypothetical protein
MCRVSTEVQCLKLGLAMLQSDLEKSVLISSAVGRLVWIAVAVRQLLLLLCHAGSLAMTERRCYNIGVVQLRHSVCKQAPYSEDVWRSGGITPYSTLYLGECSASRPGRHKPKEVTPLPVGTSPSGPQLVRRT